MTDFTMKRFRLPTGKEAAYLVPKVGTPPVDCCMVQLLQSGADGTE